MDESLQNEVRRRAGNACEYCRLPAGVHPSPFEIEHIVAQQHGGATSLRNLAFACLRCNRHKGTNIAGIARIGSRTVIVPLFHPRRHKWSRHFRWSGPYLIGRTAIGRVTVELLKINDPLRVAVRESLMNEGLFDTT